MPEQAVYTSSENGIIPGKSGYCFVAATNGVDEYILSRLEKLSEFSHESSKKYSYDLIYSLQIMDLVGSRFYILTRSVDAGFDFSGRTNYISHHLIFSEEEACQIKNPCDVFKGWNGWLNCWQNGVSILFGFNTYNVSIVSDFDLIPCKSWASLVGESVAALSPIYKVLDFPIIIYSLKPCEVLDLIHESLEIKSIQGSINKNHCSLWDTTFTTSGLSEESTKQFLWCFKYGRNDDNNSIFKLYERLKLTFRNDDKIIASELTSPPKVSLKLEQSQFKKGETIFITATIESGFPPPEIYWYSNVKDSQYSLVGTGDNINLTIDNEGEFQIYCKSINLRGESHSEITTVQITYPKSIDADSGPDNDAKATDIENQSPSDKPISKTLKFYDLVNSTGTSDSKLWQVILLAFLLVALGLVLFNNKSISGAMSKYRSTPEEFHGTTILK